MGRIDIDFINENAPIGDIYLFFGKHSDGEKILYFTNEQYMTIAHLMAKAGIFQSISEAKRNGWDRPIPEGFSTLTVGKNKSRITILNTGEENGK